jgi:NitT/TauT family transport system substrate-binding protein
LPLTLAERRGHFRDYGLNVAITDFEGGAQSLDALLAGTVDVVTGALSTHCACRLKARIFGR